MTRWCPVCESPGKPVVRGRLTIDELEALAARKVVRVTRDLPGIEPTHFCTSCPTFFRSQDRFYLTALREDGVYGVRVWPHREPRINFEMTGEGLVAFFPDTTSALIPYDELACIFNGFFGDDRDPVEWGRRRGFSVTVVASDTERRLHFKPHGPHFLLLVAKSWAQASDIRYSMDLPDALEAIGVTPVVFRGSEMHA